MMTKCVQNSQKTCTTHTELARSLLDGPEIFFDQQIHSFDHRIKISAANLRSLSTEEQGGTLFENIVGEVTAAIRSHKQLQIRPDAFNDVKVWRIARPLIFLVEPGTFSSKISLDDVGGMGRCSILLEHEWLLLELVFDVSDHCV